MNKQNREITSSKLRINRRHFYLSSLLLLFLDLAVGSTQKTFLASTTAENVVVEALPLEEHEQNLEPATLTPIITENHLSSPQVVNQGSQINLNGRTMPVAWSQWQGNNQSIHTGVSDTGAMQMLGMELLSTSNPALQPVRWFPNSASQTFTLNTQLINPYRYLDITNFAQAAGWRMEAVGDTLQINYAPSRINYANHRTQGQGKQIVLNLDGPTAWRVLGKGVVTIQGSADPLLLERFAPLPKEENNEQQTESSEPKAFTLEKSNNQIILRVDVPTGQELKVSSLGNPYRLVIDIQPETFTPKDILWSPGIRWQQKFINLPTGKFPVVWLEVDLSTPGLSLQPIWPNEGMTGINPIVSTARDVGTSAAINGGFFNRNNKLPLGAIRRNNTWFSGPILNRGAIAWDNQGRVKIGRFSLRPVFITSTRQRYPIQHVNSGYIKAGISLYTPEWGSSYTPLSDNEIVVLVQNNQVIEQIPGGKAGTTAFLIPEDGYLLALRSSQSAAANLPVNTQIKIHNQTLPGEFASYPNILGAGPLLLKNRQIVLNGEGENFSPAFNTQKASRSAIGTTSQGKIIIAAVHRRIGDRGPTLTEMAQLMQRLGTTDALNLDGGSSTSLVLGDQLIDRPPATAARVHNGIGIFLEQQ